MMQGRVGRREETAGKSVELKGHIPQEIIEEIRNRSNIVELVSEFVTLKKTGRNYVGLCPFHTEKTPSFSVNPEKQICYCFGCGEGGNELSFLMKVQNISFPEAARKLAERRGIDIPERHATEGEKTRASARAGLVKVNRLAQSFFADNYASQRGRSARDYLLQRGMSETTVERFSLGYAPPGWRNLKDYLEASGVPERLLRESGLIIYRDDGKSYDRFRERLIFPIESVGGDIIGFGGRQLGQGEPKYLNSPETPLYTKGDNLYGLFRTRDDIRTRDFVIMVEGYFDVLSLWNAGITNVVATLGTALTRRQVTLIGRYTRNVVLLYDSDEGGRGAVERSIPLFLEAGISATVVELPEGSDPDDYVRNQGREALEARILRASPLVDYYIDRIMKDRDVLDGGANLARETVAFIKTISDVIQRNLFIKRCAEKLGLDQKVIKDEVNRESAKREPASPARRSGSALDPVEIHLVHLMIEFPHLIPVVRESGIVSYCFDPVLGELASRVATLYEQKGSVSLAEVMNDYSESTVTERLLELALGESPDAVIVERMLRDTIKKIKTRWYRERHRNLKQQLIEAREKGDEGLSNSLLAEKAQLLSREKQDASWTGLQNNNG